MKNFIARANIDHYLDLLAKDDIPSNTRSVICKLLVDEENKLSHDLEQLEFAESRMARYRDRVDRLRHLRDRFADGSADRMKADGLLVDFEGFLAQVEAFCGHMRRKVNQRAV